MGYSPQIKVPAPLGRVLITEQLALKDGAFHAQVKIILSAREYSNPDGGMILEGENIILRKDDKPVPGFEPAMQEGRLLLERLKNPKRPDISARVTPSPLIIARTNFGRR